MFSAYACAAFASAAQAYELARGNARREALFRQREREFDQWEDDYLLPLMEPAARAAFLAERVRLRERREDIARLERQHRERMAVERAKIEALRTRRSFSSGSFALGVLLAELVD